MSNPQALNTSPSRYEDRPKMFRIERITAWTTGVILFIAGVVYAGVRGHLAYSHLPAVQVNFQADAPEKFPAVTICPLYVAVPALRVLECLVETAFKEDGDCSSTVYYRNYVVEGVNFYCMTVNDPQDGSSPMTSNTTNDELEIEVAINSTAIPPGEPIGALVMLHPQGQDPVISAQNSFIADVGKLTDVWLRKDVLYPINGSKPITTWSCVTSSATIQGASLNFMEFEFVFQNQGEYKNAEYYVYTVDNWLGEVGGVCALLLFLHGSFNFILMLILERVMGDSRGQRLNDRQSEMTQQ